MLLLIMIDRFGLIFFYLFSFDLFIMSIFKYTHIYINIYRIEYTHGNQQTINNISRILYIYIYLCLKVNIYSSLYTF